MLFEIKQVSQLVNMSLGKREFFTSIEQIFGIYIRLRVVIDKINDKRINIGAYLHAKMPAQQLDFFVLNIFFIFIFLFFFL